MKPMKHFPRSSWAGGYFHGWSISRQGNRLSQQVEERNILVKIILPARRACPQGPQTRGGCGETQGRAG